ncbi:MAG: hypothetical protein JKY37_09070 [Nannocystaceae bacterium]|nr:hypothetical protein [Nannocystaceae bacterium]
MGWKHGLLLVGSLVVGCGPTVTTISGEEGSSSDSSGGAPSPDQTGTSSAADSTAGTMPVLTAGSTEGSSTGPDEDGGSSSDDGSPSDDGSSSGSESSSDGGGGGLPDGSQCVANNECQSQECFVAGQLGGICGECNEDNDCVNGGCTQPNPLTSTPSVCNDGTPGSGCETDQACSGGLLCGTVLNIPNILVSTTCGDCLDDGDCDVGETCQPDYNITDLTGVLGCVTSGSLPDGHGCDEDTGPSACASGHCPLTNFMDVFQLAVCSECTDDVDCGPMETCAPPEIDLAQGLVPGACM